MPFVVSNVEEVIERKKAEDPEFAAAWEKHQKSENEFFKDTMKGLCEAVAINENRKRSLTFQEYLEQNYTAKQISYLDKMAHQNWKRDLCRQRKRNRKIREINKKLHID